MWLWGTRTQGPSHLGGKCFSHWVMSPALLPETYTCIYILYIYFPQRNHISKTHFRQIHEIYGSSWGSLKVKRQLVTHDSNLNSSSGSLTLSHPDNLSFPCPLINKDTRVLSLLGPHPSPKGVQQATSHNPVDVPRVKMSDVVTAAETYQDEESERPHKEHTGWGGGNWRDT